MTILYSYSLNLIDNFTTNAIIGISHFTHQIKFVQISTIKYDFIFQKFIHFFKVRRAELRPFRKNHESVGVVQRSVGGVAYVSELPRYVLHSP